MNTFSIYSIFMIVEELTISPPHKKMRETRQRPGFFAFFLFKGGKEKENRVIYM